MFEKVEKELRNNGNKRNKHKS